MNEAEFERLHSFLGRFDNIHPRWGSILVFLIGRCEGFVETVTLDTEKTHEYLMDKTISLLETLPETATDGDLAELVAKEFDGWYMTALAKDGSWDLTQMPYRQWSQENHVSDALISTSPYISNQAARLYIDRLLGGVH